MNELTREEKLAFICRELGELNVKTMKIRPFIENIDDLMVFDDIRRQLLQLKAKYLSEI